MIKKKIWSTPNVFLLSSGDVSAKTLTAAREGSYIGQHGNPGNANLHTLTFINHTLNSVALGVTANDFVS